MQQKKLVIILADISGYTQFMLDTLTAAVHGQMFINGLIESLIAQVDIPLVLQEIEGDAVFLYAADPGSVRDWERVVEEVSHKLGKFFEAFVNQYGLMIESTPCTCGICSHVDKLGLKIIVHAGEAMFHEVAGRSQVSGPDVILAHRLLKNSLTSKEYLLLTEQAYALMGAHLPGRFEAHQEEYSGFAPVRVRFLEADLLRARDAVYTLPATELQAAVDAYTEWGRKNALKATLQQVRHPIRAFAWPQKVRAFGESLAMGILLRLYYRHAIPKQQRERGKRREFGGSAP